MTLLRLSVLFPLLAVLAAPGVGGSRISTGTGGMSIATGDARYVNESGDSMEGQLTITTDADATCAGAAFVVTLNGSGVGDVAWCADGTADVFVTRAGDLTAGGAFTATGATVLNGAVTLGDNAADVLTVTGTIAGATPMCFEGATPDDFEGCFVVTDLTTPDKTWTLPNASGEVSLLGQAISSAEITDGEIVDADLSTSAEIAVAKIAQGTAGQVLLSDGSTPPVPVWTTLGTDVAVTGAGAVTIQADAVALGTDTINAYVATLAEGLGIDVSGVGAETATGTVAFDPTEILGSRTWGDGSTDTIVWTWDRLSAGDPAVTIGAGDFDVTTGTLKQAGTAVTLQTRSLTAGAGLSGGGDLSADRTFAADSTEADFLATAALACALAADKGKITIETGATIAWCDGATERYVALGSSTGVATSATALAADPADCSAGSAPVGINAAGAAQSCTDYEEDLANSAGLLAALNDETGTGVAVFGTAPVITTSLSQDGDVADTGYLRLQNVAAVAWEAAPAGVDYTLSVDASEILQASGAVNATGAVTGSNLSGTNTGDQTITLTGDVTGTGTGSFAATIAANSVALTTDTVGSYVASVATTAPLAGGAAGSEGAALTLSITGNGIGTAEIDETAAYAFSALGATVASSLQVPTITTAAATDLALQPGTSGKVAITKAAETLVAESVFNLTVSDQTTSYLRVINALGGDNVFVPLIETKSATDVTSAGVTYGTVAADTRGTQPVVQYDARTVALGTFTAGTRLFQWTHNYGASPLMFMTTSVLDLAGVTLEDTSGTDPVQVTDVQGLSVLADTTLGNADTDRTTVWGGLAINDDDGVATGGTSVLVQAPASLAASYTLTLPADDGTASQHLQTDGAGVLSFVTPVTATVSQNYHPRFTTANTVMGNSTIQDDGNTTAIAGVATLTGAAAHTGYIFTLDSASSASAGTPFLMQFKQATTTYGYLCVARNVAGECVPGSALGEMALRTNNKAFHISTNDTHATAALTIAASTGAGVAGIVSMAGTWARLSASSTLLATDCDVAGEVGRLGMHDSGTTPNLKTTLCVCEKTADATFAWGAVTGAGVCP